MGVIGSGDDDGVDVVGHLIEHFAEVFEFRDVGKLAVHFGGFVVIDIAERDGVGGIGEGQEEFSAASAAPDVGDVESFVCLGAAYGGAVGENQEGSGGCGASEE